MSEPAERADDRCQRRSRWFTLRQLPPPVERTGEMSRHAGARPPRGRPSPRSHEPDAPHLATTVDPHSRVEEHSDLSRSAARRIAEGRAALPAFPNPDCRLPVPAVLPPPKSGLSAQITGLFARSLPFRRNLPPPHSNSNLPRSAHNEPGPRGVRSRGRSRRKPYTPSSSHHARRGGTGIPPVLKRWHKPSARVVLLCDRRPARRRRVDVNVMQQQE